MARISKYQNDNSSISEEIINKMLSLENLEINDIEIFQQRFGVSNAELSRLSEHSTAQISFWKNGESEMPKRVRQHFKLLFDEFERQFKTI